MIRDSLAKLVRHTKSQHSCVKDRLVFNRIAATIPTMDEDKDDSNDNKWRCLLYDDSQWKERLGRAVPATQATLRMRSASKVSLSRQYVKHCPATSETDAEIS